ncbi:hypothetical protein, conserved [Eimeria brunetti]|uniref:Transmembrane protein n=1 Tax=Eimeria brunetti TaxID=51314 RepID=U6LN63_9EIME|nr:hypothetical protein, conserved [Eimeria brunetti]
MQKNDSSFSQRSSASSPPVGSGVSSDTSSLGNNSLPHSNQQSISIIRPAIESLEGTSPEELLVATKDCDVKAAAECGSQLSHIDGPCETEELLVPFNKRPSYLRISRRLKQIRVLPALTACFSSLVITSAVCGAEIAIRAVDIFSAVALLCSSVVACILAAFATHQKSHVLLVGLVMLEILFTLYTIAFACVGIVNVGLLRKRQDGLQQDDTMQAEQRENALKITRRMLTEQAIFAGLYFLTAAAHCCAAASVNHLRAVVRPFDSRLRRKRQRAAAMKKLNVLPPPKEGEIDGAREQGAKARRSSKDLQLLQYNHVGLPEDPRSHGSDGHDGSHSSEPEEGADMESVRRSASNALTSSPSSDATGSITAGNNSAKALEDSQTLA